MSKQVYNIYPTLLDKYSSYLYSDAIWDKYWGFSANPAHTPEEFHEIQFYKLIDEINRVKGEYGEAADRGTCFNEIIDCIILNRPTERADMRIESDKEQGKVYAWMHDFCFEFPLDLCVRWAKKFKGAIPQHRCEASIETARGLVRLYGHIDELMPFEIHDIKTTNSYTFGKFRDNWQHRVYPLCMHESGMQVQGFVYDVLEIGTAGYDDYAEYYAYNHDRTKEELYFVLMDFIDFLHENDNLIDHDRTKVF